MAPTARWPPTESPEGTVGLGHSPAGLAGLVGTVPSGVIGPSVPLGLY